jgi:hypothetical protein
MSASSHADAGTTSLRRLLDSSAGAKGIASYLDGLPSGARIAEVLSVTGRGVKELYDAVRDADPMNVEELVPASTTGTLIYEGRNSLPMFSRFQKRFTRVGGVVVGYNHQTMSFATGPGYFVVKPASGQGEHGRELLFDYTEPPPAGTPAGWPGYVANDHGLVSRGVYMNMHDYVRRVARGIVVGKAYKLGVDQKAYFSLSLAE